MYVWYPKSYIIEIAFVRHDFCFTPRSATQNCENEECEREREKKKKKKTENIKTIENYTLSF